MDAATVVERPTLDESGLLLLSEHSQLGDISRGGLPRLFRLCPNGWIARELRTLVDALRSVFEKLRPQVEDWRRTAHIVHRNEYLQSCAVERQGAVILLHLLRDKTQESRHVGLLAQVVHCPPLGVQAREFDD
jgi:hypothetical protein